MDEAEARLGSLAPLRGTWRGDGTGQWHDARFTYTEELTFADTGKPILAYRQRTRGADGGPLHAEDGFIRSTPAGVELVIAQGIGIVEVLAASWEGAALVATPLQIAPTPTAKVVTGVERRWELAGDWLRATMSMATDGGTLRPHLDSLLHRVE